MTTRRRREYLGLAWRALVYAPVLVVVALGVSACWILGGKAIARGRARQVDGDGRGLRSSGATGGHMPNWLKHALTAFGSAAFGAVVTSVASIGSPGVNVKTIAGAALAAGAAGVVNYWRPAPSQNGQQ